MPRRKSGQNKNDQTAPSFNFVHVTNPLDFRSADNRAHVRSHITTRQHRLSRLNKSRIRDASTPSQVLDEDTENDVEPDAGRQHRHVRPIRSRDLEASDELLERVTVQRDDLKEVDTPERVARNDDMIKAILSPKMIVRSVPLASKSSRTSLLDDPNDAIASMLGRLRLDFSGVMDHYNWIVAVQSVDWQKHFMPNSPAGAGYGILIPGISKDPALLATAVLIATGHLLAIRNSPMSQSAARTIYELRDFVIRHINTAIQDPKRALTDPLLVAVLVIAAHEGLQGSVENFHIHMQGLVKMINMRGGFSNLNQNQKFLKEYIAWQDTNVSTIMRCKPYHLLADNADDAPKVQPNPRMWLLLDAIRE